VWTILHVRAMSARNNLRNHVLVYIGQKCHDQIIEILPDERAPKDMVLKLAGVCNFDGLDVSASPIGWTKRRKLT